MPDAAPESLSAHMSENWDSSASQCRNEAAAMVTFCHCFTSTAANVWLPGAVALRLGGKFAIKQKKLVKRTNVLHIAHHRVRAKSTVASKEVEQS